MSGKYALIIGNTEYADQGLAQLTAPGRDAEDFARVLSEKELCAFDDVSVLLNQPSFAINEAIEDFFDQKKPDDLLVLYFSGHGVRDELGALYLAAKNTNRIRLRSTAIKSDFMREAMDQSRSRRQVLILDCCNSGAFAQGTKAATGVSIGAATAFESGFGRIILTASDSTQFAWEGDKVIGETDNSLFTHFLVEGLEGKADRDGDGRITVDELYDYAYEKVKLATPKQTPSKFSSKQQGEIVLRQNIPIEATQPVPLPDDLLAAIKSSLPFVREGAVRQLEDLLKGRNLALARSARQALEHIAEADDSRVVSRAATKALEVFRLAGESEEQKVTDEFSKREKEAKVQHQVYERMGEIDRHANEKAEKYTTQRTVSEEDGGHNAKAKLEEEQLLVEERRNATLEEERLKSEGGKKDVLGRNATQNLEVEVMKLPLQKKATQEVESRIAKSDRPIDISISSETRISLAGAMLAILINPSERRFIQIFSSPTTSNTMIFLLLLLTSSLYIPLYFLFQLALELLGFQTTFSSITNPDDGNMLAIVIVGLAIGTGILSLISFTANAVIIQWTAKLFGGLGALTRLIYPLGLISISGQFLSIPLALISSIPFLDVFSIIISIGFWLYILFLQIMATKAVHQFGWLAASISVLIPLIISALIVYGGTFLFGLILSLYL